MIIRPATLVDHRMYEIDLGSPQGDVSAFNFYKAGDPAPVFLGSILATEMDAYLTYLDGLRERGETNMLGAGEYLQAIFDLEKEFAKAILIHWIETFSTRHAKDNQMQTFLLAIDESAPSSLDLLVKLGQQCTTENLGDGQYRVTGIPTIVQGLAETHPDVVFKCEAD